MLLLPQAVSRLNWSGSTGIGLQASAMVCVNAMHEGSKQVRLVVVPQADADAYRETVFVHGREGGGGGGRRHHIHTHPGRAWKAVVAPSRALCSAVPQVTYLYEAFG